MVGRAGANAKYKGEGAINDAGSYGFMLTATDGQVNGGGGIDTFRIKIWDKNDGDAVVYDNQAGVSDDLYSGTALGGGNIVVNSGKGPSGGKADILTEEGSEVGDPEAIDEGMQDPRFFLPYIEN